MTKKIIRERFAANLQHLMHRDNISRSELAKILGIEPQNITYYVNAKAFPKEDSLVLIRNLFNVTIDDLLLKNFIDGVNEPPEIYQTKEHIKSQIPELFANFKEISIRFKEIQNALIYIYEQEKHNRTA